MLVLVLAVAVAVAGAPQMLVDGVVVKREPFQPEETPHRPVPVVPIILIGWCDCDCDDVCAGEEAAPNASQDDCAAGAN